MDVCGGGSVCLSEVSRGVNKTLCVSSALILSKSVERRWLCLWEKVLSSRPAFFRRALQTAKVWDRNLSDIIYPNFRDKQKGVEIFSMCTEPSSAAAPWPCPWHLTTQNVQLYTPEWAWHIPSKTLHPTPGLENTIDLPGSLLGAHSLLIAPYASLQLHWGLPGGNLGSHCPITETSATGWATMASPHRTSEQNRLASH